MPKIHDITGKTFGFWTVNNFAERVNNITYFNCVCKCGTEKKVNANSLRRGETISSGCSRVEDVTGRKFGRLTAIRKTETKNRQAMWECVCDCGNVGSYSLSKMKKGNTKSCGCYFKDKMKEFHEDSDHSYLIKHGHSTKKKQTDTYKVWAGIRTRCVNPNDTAYQNYGGRGITICERWKDSYENFLEDMGERPGKDYSIDRIDNEQGYSPENCKWATRKEQHRNTRRNVWIEFNGEKKVMADWADEYGIKRQTLKHRLAVLGWDIETALTTPSRKSKNK